MDEKFKDALLSNNHLAEHINLRKEFIRKDLSFIWPWFRACRVKILLVTDGSLDFGMGDFGLSAFINCLQNDGRFYVKFDITLAHLKSNVSDNAMAISVPGISKRIKDFRFDEPTHFSTALYDQVWMFGFETFYHFPSYNHRNNNRTLYPSNGLSDNELTALSNFMNSGKGVFATGDHGALGRGLCGSVPRVKSMRFWDSTSPVDEVSMTGSRRNDTNQVGHDAGTQFSDQSDDVPQVLDPKFYHQRIGPFLQVLYPHPILCSRLGVINVFPDHPHEGECKIPATAAELAEYPIVSGVQTLPEVIARSRVFSGNTGTLFNAAKSATVQQTFGAISAYDGHRAKVGRVVTDATWHHFVNVNLIGLVEGAGFDDLDPVTSSATKHDGFLSSAQGLAHMAKIKEYYINVGVWLSPPSLISCFNSKFWWKLVYSDRIMEAALADPNVLFEKITPNLFYSIGTHARDVLGRSASQCQTILFLIELLKIKMPDLIPKFDPWFPVPPKPEPYPEPEPPLPWFDPTPIVNIMLGSVLVSLRQQIPDPPAEFDEKFVNTTEKIINEAAGKGLEMGLKYYSREIKSYDGLLNDGLKFLGSKAE